MPDVRQRSSASVKRAFAFLDLVAAARTDGITLSDLARASELPVSTCHRYVTTLLELGVLHKSSSDRLFLGIKLVTLTQAALQGNTLRTLARSHLEKLATLSGETVHLGMHSEYGVVYIDKIDSDKTVRLVSRIGDVVPHYCTAMCKSILASLSTEERAPLLVGAVARTPHTLIGDALIGELAAVAERRWAIDEQENEEGVRCVGAAIATPDGELLGAVSISGPAGRFTRELCAELAPAVLAATDTIGQRSAWPNPIEPL